MRVLVVGAAGLLGSNVVAASRDRGHEVVGSYHSTAPSFDVPLHRLDVRDRTAITDLVDEVDPTAVINCAAMTDVDGCEHHPDAARAVNDRAPGTIASVCDDRGVGFVHVSTDYVFDGERRRPYAEDAETNPIQVYGESKLAGERAVDRNHHDPLVVRLSFVYGRHGATGDLAGFPAWVRGRLSADESTPLFTDQFVTPSRASGTAHTILGLLDSDVAGIVHVASRSCVTPYEFGERVRQAMNKPASLVERSSQRALDRPADRPVYTCFDVSRVETELGRTQPTFEEDFAALGDEFC